MAYKYKRGKISNTEQEKRDETAEYLKIWKKTYSIEKTADFFGYGYNRARKVLLRSKRYKILKKRSSRKWFFVSKKNSEIRNEIAKYLNGWRNGLKVYEIAKKYNVCTRKIGRYLKYSKIYSQKMNKIGIKTGDKQQLLIKNSDLRNKIAKILNIWKKTKDINKSLKNAMAYDINEYRCRNIFLRLKSYRKYYKNHKVKLDYTQYVLKCAKRKKALSILGGRCQNCGNKEEVCLEFHHPNKNKEHDISDIIEKSYIEIEKEAKKCIILCRNCHAKEHANILLYKKLEKNIIAKSVRI